MGRLCLMDDPVRVISTVQVGITATGILIGAIGEPLVRDLFGDGLTRGLGFLVAFSVVTPEPTAGARETSLGRARRPSRSPPVRGRARSRPRLRARCAPAG